MKKIVTKLLSLIILITILFPEDKLKTGLVLSGGGMKGFGHLGTLYMIDSLNIPIDFVVGTSIGAISAALYATGHSAYEIDKIATTAKWEEIFGQTRKRNELFYFQKNDDAKFQLTFSLRGFSPTSPISLSSGQYSYEHLLDLFSGYVNVKSYDDLVIPFRCNATDIISGNEVVFKDGSLARSLRISSSIPMIFSPIEYNDKLLVDGGLINNLPINLAEDLGAEYIIASNVMSRDKSKNEIIDVFNIVQKIIDLYGRKNEQINLLKADILISPQSKEIGIIDFNINNITEMKLDGKKTAYNNLNKFLALKPQTISLINLASIPEDIIKIDSLILVEDMQGDTLINNMFLLKKTLSKEDITNNLIEIRRSHKYHNIYSKYKKNTYNQSYDIYLYGIKNKPIFITEIEINGNKKINEKEILTMFSIKKNEVFDITILNREIKKAYKTDRFEYINYDIIDTDEDNSRLILNIKESQNKKLKLGVAWNNYYKLIGKIKLDILNKPFRNFKLQDELLFSGIKKNKLSIYYLLTHNNKTNLIPFIEFINQIKKIGVFDNSNNTINEINHDFKETSYGLIYPISKFGSLIFSHNKFDSNYKFNILNTENNYYNNNIYYKKIKLNIDQIDNLLHPRDGYQINLSYQKSDDTFQTFNNNVQIEKKGYNYLCFKLDYYKTYNYNHTIRFLNQYNKSNDIIPLYLESKYGGAEWAIGYNEFTLSSINLNLVGLEYQYHFKNNVTYRLMLNKVTEIDSYKDSPINYGIGLKIKSLLGPINFTWGRGHIIPFDKNSKENNIFYFNFGVEI